MANYWVGEKLHVDMPGDRDPHGIPILDDNSVEFYVEPEDMGFYGYGHDINAARWQASNEEAQGE